MAESLLVSREAQYLAMMTLNRPDKRNALSRALRSQIVRALDELEDSDDVRVVILTGAGSAFCAGFDRAEFAEGNMAEIFAESIPYHRRVYLFEKPLIAAVNGPALGGGCDLAALADFRLAATTAWFGQPQVQFGGAPLYELMRSVIGSGPAREMCLSGRRYDAREALAIGLVNRIVEAPRLLEAACEVAREIAALPEGMARRLKRAFISHQPPLFQ